MEFKTFNHNMFGEIRISDHEGKPWFVASDVAKALGYADPSRAIVQHCKRSMKSTILANRRDGKPMPPVNITLIPETDVYRLIMRSNLEAAVDFQDWVCDEVLPALREEGSYSLTSSVKHEYGVNVLGKWSQYQIVKADDIKIDPAVMGNPVAMMQAYMDMLKEKNRDAKHITVLSNALGCGEYVQSNAIPWLKEYFKISRALFTALGFRLSEISRELSERPIPIRAFATSNSVFKNTYSPRVVAELKRRLDANPDYMGSHRIKHKEPELPSGSIIDGGVTGRSDGAESTVDARQEIIAMKKKTSGNIVTKNVELGTYGRPIERIVRTGVHGIGYTLDSIPWIDEIFMEHVRDENFWKNLRQNLYKICRDLGGGRNKHNDTTYFSELASTKCRDFILESNDRMSRYRRPESFK